MRSKLIIVTCGLGAALTSAAALATPGIASLGPSDNGRIHGAAVLDADGDGYYIIVDAAQLVDINGDGSQNKDDFIGKPDCKDSNAGVNPAAKDFPGNKIDEDCNGSDLAPVSPELRKQLTRTNQWRGDYVSAMEVSRCPVGVDDTICFLNVTGDTAVFTTGDGIVFADGCKDGTTAGVLGATLSQCIPGQDGIREPLTVEVAGLLGARAGYGGGSGVSSTKVAEIETTSNDALALAEDAMEEAEQNAEAIEEVKQTAEANSDAINIMVDENEQRDTRLDEVEEDVDNHDLTLYGDGTENNTGLTGSVGDLWSLGNELSGDVSDLEETTKDHEERIDDLENEGNFTQVYVGGTVIGQQAVPGVVANEDEESVDIVYGPWSRGAAAPGVTVGVRVGHESEMGRHNGFVEYSLASDLTVSGQRDASHIVAGGYEILGDVQDSGIHIGGSAQGFAHMAGGEVMGSNVVSYGAMVGPVLCKESQGAGTSFQVDTCLKVGVGAETYGHRQDVLVDQNGDGDLEYFWVDVTNPISPVAGAQLTLGFGNGALKD